MKSLFFSEINRKLLRDDVGYVVEVVHRRSRERLYEELSAAAQRTNIREVPEGRPPSVSADEIITDYYSIRSERFRGAFLISALCSRVVLVGPTVIMS